MCSRLTIDEPKPHRLDLFFPSFRQNRYNQARKLSYNPFPFPHAQMTTFFTLTSLLIFPFLYYSFVNALPFACILNFVTVLCFLGIHAVARELEEPFKNVPNGKSNACMAYNCTACCKYNSAHSQPSHLLPSPFLISLHYYEQIYR